MAPPQFPLDDNNGAMNTIMVAIDKDKNSQYAVRWAVDHLALGNPSIYLLHIKHFKIQPLNSSHGGNGRQDNADVNQLFVPYRGYCARKGIQLKEVVVEDNDVSRGILEYINKNFVSSLVVGASTKKVFARSFKFKPSDLPSSLMKSVPDFCSVYVISKGKVVSVRTAQRPAANTPAPPRAPSIVLSSPIQVDGELDDGSKASRLRRISGIERLSTEDSTKGTGGREKHRQSGSNSSMEGFEFSNRGLRSNGSHDSFSDDSDSMSFGSGSMDISNNQFDFTSGPGSPKDSYPQSARDIEIEMRRLKLELKQTLDMYSTARKEALTAKKTATDLNLWKMEEAKRFEEARNAEEAALAIAEIEKAKCMAAIEAAEKAQKLAEMEAHRRRQAEMKAKREAEEKDRALSALVQNDVRYRKYTIEEIEEATETFAPSNKVGEGGYGPVYKGKLDHTPVAIKVLRPDAAQGKKQFQQEVEVLSCIRHPNMVLLLGACPEFGCLVYEYMNQGSLEDRLLQRGNTPPLSWRVRFRIAAEIATALLFLHQAKPEPLVHRDLKPANILLDQNYVSKISDVGLARLVPPSISDSVTQYHLTSAAGTFCYIDPEYQQTGMLTTKSDIYSLGIMFLQIITAKSPMGLSHHVGRSIEKGTFSEMLDSAVPDWPVEEALSFAKLSLQCAELRKRDRPDLGTVIVPELNRLRELGMNNTQSSTSPGNYYSYRHGNSNSRESRESSQSYTNSRGSVPPRSPTSSTLSLRSNLSQDEISKTSDAQYESS